MRATPHQFLHCFRVVTYTTQVDKSLIEILHGTLEMLPWRLAMRILINGGLGLDAFFAPMSVQTDGWLLPTSCENLWFNASLRLFVILRPMRPIITNPTKWTTILAWRKTRRDANGHWLTGNHTRERDSSSSASSSSSRPISTKDTTLMAVTIRAQVRHRRS